MNRSIDDRSDVRRSVMRVGSTEGGGGGIVSHSTRPLIGSASRLRLDRMILDLKGTDGTRHGVIDAKHDSLSSAMLIERNLS